MNGCLFSIHIHKGAFIISTFGLIISVCLAGWCLFFHSFVFLGVCTLSFLCYLSLTIGNHLEIGAFYWTFLLFMPLAIISELAFALITILLHAAAMFLDAKEIETEKDVQLLMRMYPVYLFEISQITLIFGIVVFLVACIEIYFYSVVIRAYIYLQKVRQYPPPLTVGWSHRV